VLPIDVPPLRQRMEDLPLLIQGLVTRICQQLRLDGTPTLDRKTLALLSVYHWPGNVRELRNRLERSLALSGGKRISFSLMFDGRIDENWPLNINFRVGSDLNTFTQEVRRRLIVEALKRAKGKRQMAAKLLGITRYSLKRHMTNLGLMANEDQ
jgi:DNA-binding NtrC family response regulator